MKRAQAGQPIGGTLLPQRDAPSGDTGSVDQPMSPDLQAEYEAALASFTRHPNVRVLVGKTPIEDLPPEKVVAIRRWLNREVQAALQRWVNNNFQAIFEEELRKVREEAKQSAHDTERRT